jgi:hypothetical protein
MNPEITQFDIIQSKLLQQLKQKQKQTRGSGEPVSLT